MSRATLVQALLAALLVASAPAPLSAQNHERARSAVEAGEAKPLGKVLAAIARRYPGRALDAKLQERGDRLVYKIKWLARDGKVWEIVADARSGDILSAR